MEHLYLSSRQTDGSSFMELLMGTFSSVRIEANSDFLETGLSGVNDRHS